KSTIPAFVDLVKSHGRRPIYRVSARPIQEVAPMATSVNGYPVLSTNRTTGPLPRLRKWVVPGANRHLLVRDGSTGFLLLHFALWWHESIGKLDAKGAPWDEWGWAVRPVRGQ